MLLHPYSATGAHHDGNPNCRICQTIARNKLMEPSIYVLHALAWQGPQKSRAHFSHHCFALCMRFVMISLNIWKYWHLTCSAIFQHQHVGLPGNKKYTSTSHGVSFFHIFPPSHWPWIGVSPIFKHTENHMKMVCCNIFQMPKTYHGLGHYILSPWNGFMQPRSITNVNWARLYTPATAAVESAPQPFSRNFRTISSFPSKAASSMARVSLAKIGILGTHHVKPGLLKPNFLIWGVSLVELNKGDPFSDKNYGDPRRIWGLRVLDISLHHRSVIWVQRKLGERSLSWWLEDHLLEFLFEQMRFNCFSHVYIRYTFTKDLPGVLPTAPRPKPSHSKPLLRQFPFLLLLSALLFRTPPFGLAVLQEWWETGEMGRRWCPSLLLNLC